MKALPDEEGIETVFFSAKAKLTGMKALPDEEGIETPPSFLPKHPREYEGTP